MTKMVVTTAALQLRDAGTLDIDAPVTDYYPEFADTQVLTGFDGDTPQYRPAASRATVRQLLTHTSGLAYWFFNADIGRWENVTENPGVLSGSLEVLRAPLVADPGTRFEYGINTDILGRVVAAAAGRELDAVVSEQVLQPLGMTDTTYWATDEQRTRMAPVCVRDESGAWVATDVDYSREPEFVPAGHGLYSTAADYVKFQQALLGGGEHDGVRILSEQTVAEAFRNQIGDLDVPVLIPSADPATTADLHVGPGHKWGWGLLLNTADEPGRRRAGSGAWAGLCNTHFWVDPEAGVTGAIYSQTLPFVDPPAWQLYRDFEEALYAARG